MQLNEIYFAGFAGRDAEEINANGTRIVKFTLCHTEKGRDNREDVSTWVTVVVFGNWCDLATKVAKGDNVVVKGKLQVRNWEGKDGAKGTSVEVVAMTLGIFPKSTRTEAQLSTSSSQTTRTNPSKTRDEW